MIMHTDFRIEQSHVNTVGYQKGDLWLILRADYCQPLAQPLRRLKSTLNALLDF